MDSFGAFKQATDRMSILRSTLLPIMLVLTSLVVAQNTWRRSYGGSGIDEGHSIRQTLDGGYIVVGSTGSFGSGASDMYVLRLDSTGEPIWTRTIGGVGVESGVSCRELQDGFVIAGTTSQGANGSYDFMLVRLDEQGIPIWERNYGSSAWDLCHAMEVLSDGFILGGITYGDDYVQGAAYVVRTNMDGDLLWTRSLGGPEKAECNGLAVSSDQSIGLVGSMQTSSGQANAMLAKLDQNGDEVWVVSLAADSGEVLNSAVFADDGSLVACGTTRSGSTVLNIYLLSVDQAGQMLWERSLGNTADAGGAEIRRQANGGYAFTGYNSLNQGNRDMILTMVDDQGYFQGGNNYGDGRPADGYSVDATADGGYVLTGWLEQGGAGIRSVYVVKTDSAGLTEFLTVQDYSDPLPVMEILPQTMALVSPTILSPNDELIILPRIGSRSNVTIYDVHGAVLSVLPVEPGYEIRIDVSFLAPGMYFLKLEERQKAPLIGKFVVTQ